MKSLSALIVVCILVFAVTADPPPGMEKFPQYVQECVAETGVDQSELGIFKSDDFSGASQKFKCFVKCMGEKSGMTVKGEQQVEKMRDMFSKSPKYNEEKFNKAMAECKSVSGADDCEKAFNMMACQKKIMKE